jgi:hypothetical protein
VSKIQKDGWSTSAKQYYYYKKNDDDSKPDSDDGSFTFKLQAEAKASGSTGLMTTLGAAALAVAAIAF